MTEELRGTVRKIIFSSDDGRFCVFLLEDKESRKIMTAAYRGPAPYVGQPVLLRGCWERHPRFGMQFKCSTLENTKPEESEEIKQFLASGLIDGIGPSMAGRIVDHFGRKTLDVFENRIDDLRQVPGIGRKTLAKIKESYEKVREEQELIMFLQSLGISESFAADIRKRYGGETEDVLSGDPYRMVRDIPGLGFQEVDRIALAKGVDPDDADRVTKGIEYTISRALAQGHACAPESSVFRNASLLLGVTEDIVREAGKESIENGFIPSLVWNDKRYLYLPSLYEAETESALRIKSLLHAEPLGSSRLAVEKFEREKGLTLADRQREAVEKALKSGVLIITGGPGTGKTTLVQAIITAARQFQLKVRLMAPTGRAAKRLSLSSGVEADTIHKALEAELHDSGRTFFNRNESDPLKEDLIIVDEASMMDISLFYHLLCALKEGARLILVGDIDQLPPVGPGSPLKDLIAWGEVPVVRLEHIFRQKEGSGIIDNAARIREGQMCYPDEEGEFLIYYAASEPDAFREIMLLCRDMDYGSEKMKMKMQVLSPMYRGACGVDHLNRAIQELVHDHPVEGAVHFLPGDKVMQKKNDYDKGVYNGDLGIVWAVDKNKIFVRFDSKEVVYEGEERSSIQLAYAATVHKSQGSEYDTVILVLLPTQGIMLKRNLLYTGVTRARKKTILISTEDAIARAVSRADTASRYSLFLPLLKGEAKS
ncbi:ATP-dependent RecD-like DNA helicase [uncultured Dialister sp.]|uniref:SF1B family DNA helicase RecD2 n=1 Tax=uncultured Dialister sp. TaxID=278064 RepID=UPI00266F2FB7|nr:ATP-dependent RecD-like DNA helicase [uncultured Dialister sp.]